MIQGTSPVKLDTAVRSTRYRGRSLAEEQQGTNNERDRSDPLRAGTETFFERAAALQLTPAEQRALLHVRSGELRALRTQPAAEVGLDLPTLQRRLDYALPLMERMLAALPP